MIAQYIKFTLKHNQAESKSTDYTYESELSLRSSYRRS